jgi:hypothetical protein
MSGYMHNPSPDNDYRSFTHCQPQALRSLIGFNKNNNTVLENLLLVLIETIIQSLQMIGIIFVSLEQNRAV